MTAMKSHAELESIAALDAIGAATEDEASAFRAHRASCADCRRARDEYEEAATLLARDLDPVIPPPALRDRIFLAIDRLESRDNVVDARDLFGSRRWWMVAAALFLALWGWRELSVRVIRAKATTGEAEMRRLAGGNLLLTARNGKLSAQMAALGSEDTRTISLTG